MICSLFLFLPLAVSSAPIDVGDRKQLFIDGRFIAERERIELRANPPQKLGWLRDEEGKPLQGHISRVIEDGGKVKLYLGAEDVRVAVRALGRITGRVDVEELLDVVFRDFCIGK